MNDGFYKELYVTRKEQVIIQTTQYTNAVPLVFRVMDWDVPGAASATIYVQKPSGLLVFKSATISGQEITVNATTQMTAEVGNSQFQIRVVNGTDLLHTFVGILEVSPSIADDSAVESQDEFTALEDALAQVADVVSHTELKSKGSATRGVYFDSNGVPQPMTYTLADNVPANQVISDSITVTSLPATFTKTGMTTNHKMAAYEIGTPSAQISDWKITPQAGSYKVEGSISGSTTLDITFIYVP